MRLAVLSLALAFGLSACGGDINTSTKSGDPGSNGGDPAGDPGGPGDVGPGDSSPGDSESGDPGAAAVIAPSAQLCGSSGKVSSSSYHGIVCLSPIGSGGNVSTSSSYKWIPGPAHIVEAE